jgi:hypothetical protein
MILGACLFLAAPAAATAAEAVNAELIRLHDDLRLSDTQKAAWKAYATAIAPNPQMQARHTATQDLLPLVPTPRRIALIEATMAQDTADFRRQGQAVIAFYNQLTPGQQKTFDDETLPSASGEDEQAPQRPPAPRP